MNKKVVSLLLSAAMIFTMNAAVFAEGNVASVDGEVGVENVYKTPTEKDQSENKKMDEQSLNKKNDDAVKEAAKAGVTIVGVDYAETISYTGKKINSKAILDETSGAMMVKANKLYNGLYVSANGFAAPVKAVKIKKKGQNVGDTVTWTIKSIEKAGYVVSMNAAGDWADWATLTKKEAKEGYKSLKSALKNIKNIEFNTYITTGYYTHVIDAASANAVKKGGWSNEIAKVFQKEIKMNDGDTRTYGYGNALVVTKKNGTIKKVQTVTFVPDKTTNLRAGLVTEESHGNRGYYVKKLAFRTLKKDKDYTISGNTVVLDKTNYDAVGDLSNFQANW